MICPIITTLPFLSLLLITAARLSAVCSVFIRPPMLLLLTASCLLALTSAISLPDKRRACKNQNITIIPDEFGYYEEAFELSFDSSLSVNNVPFTRIVEEECGFREKEDLVFTGRRKRSVIGKGVKHLSKLLHLLYHNGKRLLKPELLTKITHVLSKVKLSKATVVKASMLSAYSFYELIWTDMDRIRKEVKDDNFEGVLENALRASIQMLVQSGKLTELLLNEPSIFEKIKRRLPTKNSKLMEMVEATNVMCHQGHRDSQVVIFMKLKIPKIAKIASETCDDIGVVDKDTYQYYDLPTTTFSRDGKKFQVEIGECFLENFIFCPSQYIKETECDKENLEKCVLIKDKLPMNFSRELVKGFAVYGSFTQAITRKDGLSDQWSLTPHVLYHLIPRNNEVVSIGKHHLKQHTDSEDTVFNQV